VKSINLIKKNNCRIGYCLLCIACVAVFFLPSLRKGLMMGWDSPFHMARIESLYRALQSGVFPAKIRPCLNYTYGYGVGFFYPDLFLYFPAVLMLIGTSLEIAYKSYLLLILITTWFLTFLSVRKLTGNSLAGAVSGTLLLYAPHFMYEVYYITGIGTYTAMAFIPAAVCGFIMVQKQIEGGGRYFIIGLIGTLLSHSTSFILLAVTLAMMFICSIDQIIKHPKLLLRYILYAVIGVLVTTGYWLPALEQIRYQTFKAQTNHLFKVEDSIVNIADLIPRELGWSIAVVLLVSMMIAILNGIIRHYWNRIFITLIAIAATENIWMCNEPFWNTFGKYLEFLQFPDRIGTITSCLTAIAAGIAVTDLDLLIGDKGTLDTRRYKTIGIITFIVVCAAYCIHFNADSYWMETENFANRVLTDEIRGIGSGEEWLPSTCSSGELNQPDTALDPGNNGAEGVKIDDDKYFDVYLDLSKPYYVMPYVYYYGYSAYLLDENGNPAKELRTEKASYNAQLQVDLPDGGTGIAHVLVTYRKTKLQKTAYVISAVTIVMTIIVYIILATRKCLKMTIK